MVTDAEQSAPAGPVGVEQGINPARTGGYAPEWHYAVLGDMRALALVALDGAIDWLAIPTMADPPVCAAILDPDGGGSITLAPTVPFKASRRYVGASMVVETTYTTVGGTVRVTDALNMGASGRLPWSELARLVEVDSGQVPMRWAVRPGHRLSNARPWAHLHDGLPQLVVGDLQLVVVTDQIGDPTVSNHGVCGEFVAREGPPGLLAVVATGGEPVFVPTAAEISSRVGPTVDTWCRWSEQVDYTGPWRDIVVRSALVLKALTLGTTGAISGAATTSLPEKIGGKRNFDYRYAWIRDASFAIDAMNRLGLSGEVHASLSWLLTVTAHTSPDLRVFYALDGSVPNAEMREVDAPGYQSSTPVHVGNSAAAQTQLGCFGDLLDAVWRYVQAGGRLDAGTAAMAAELAERTCELWRTPDAGLWELGDTQHYTISKIGCWVALDRCLRLAQAGQLTSLLQGRWRAERDEIRSWIDANCWSQAKGAYTFYAGTDDLDAAVLLAARTGYCACDDPRLGSTIDAIKTGLTAGGPLLFRYSGQRGKEGAFLACSCWLVEALAYVGRVAEATEVFEGVVARANDVGLYSEEMDPTSGALLGNIPQTLSHLAIIGAATALSKAQEGAPAAISAKYAARYVG
ncbi:MAG: glycoside hydrolase family 15 protein [Pseudonocardiales bacterium]|nr:MAG: glycoside hydrolase family 15 protein [Pseudonocardiales bacterium]